MTKRKALLTGCAGFIGGHTTTRLACEGFDIVGLDNLSRIGGEENLVYLKGQLDDHFTFYQKDIRSQSAIDKIMKEEGPFDLVIHEAGQVAVTTSVTDPREDFEINALGTLNILEGIRKYSPEAFFIYASTNKVYGDRPNEFDYRRENKRFEPLESEPFYQKGFDELLSVDQCTHSLFGASKLSADILVQEYGRYFGMKTAAFRGGCLTGWRHQGAQLHGFLSFLIKKSLLHREFTVIGYDGFQVRDNIDSSDVILAFDEFIKKPSNGAVFNLGGGRQNSISVLEALELCEEKFSIKINITYEKKPRIGDHKWWISDMSKFQSQFPNFRIQKNINQIFDEIGEAILHE